MCPSLERALDLEPDVAEERVVPRLPSEECTNQLRGVDRPTPLEDDPAIVTTSVDIARFEAIEHVVAEHLRPQIPVITGVVAKQVAEACLEVRPCGERESGDLV